MSKEYQAFSYEYLYDSLKLFLLDHVLCMVAIVHWICVILSFLDPFILNGGTCPFHYVYLGGMW